MLASATRPLHTEGVVVASVFVARKSLLSTAIWLLILLSEMSSSAFLETTCTTDRDQLPRDARGQAGRDAPCGEQLDAVLIGPE
jgi:hypothetical protein